MNLRTPLEIEALRGEMNEISWFHSIDLGDDLITPGSEPQGRDVYLHLPADLTGLSVLDIGARDGKYSFEAEKRGALDVMAIDPELPRAFFFAHVALRSRVRYQIGDVENIYRIGLFDVALFLGVLYHLKHAPMLALENIHRILKRGGLLILETAIANDNIPDPILEFIEDDYDGDPTNWWLPNSACVEAMLRSTGFTDIKRMVGIPTRACWHARKP